ncbi:MAG: lipopolysaccharide biosynthesis protein, partial [Methylocella sp.]
MFLSELVVLPTGILTLAILTRALGPHHYGVFALAVSFVSWIEWGISSIYGRAAIKLLSEAADWRPAARSIIRLCGGTGLAAALLLWIFAPAVARFFREEELLTTLWLLGLDIPIFCLGHAYRAILVGTGKFRERALTSASRWTARFVLIALFISIGFSVRGAIFAMIGASVVELLVGHINLRLSLFGERAESLKALQGYFLPLFLSSVCFRLFERADLFTLKALGGSAELAGFYAAAQNISVVPGLFALSFTPLLLATLSRLRGAGESVKAGRIARNAVRFALGLLPFAAVVAGSALEIVSLIAGPSFLPSSGVLAFLIFAALFVLFISVAATLLIAAEKPAVTFVLGGPLALLAIAGHLFFIPRFGALGASIVTASAACLGAGFFG